MQTAILPFATHFNLTDWLYLCFEQGFGSVIYCLAYSDTLHLTWRIWIPYITPDGSGSYTFQPADSDPLITPNRFGSLKWNLLDPLHYTWRIRILYILPGGSGSFTLHLVDSDPLITPNGFGSLKLNLLDPLHYTRWIRIP